MKNSPFTAAFAALLLLGAASAGAQTLYASNRDTLALEVLDPATGVATSTIAVMTETANGIANVTGMAMDPATGVLHLAYQDGGGATWRIGSIDLVTAVVAPLAVVSMNSVRDMTFDGLGNLWIATGSGGSNPHSVGTVNLATGVLTLQIAAPPTDRNKLAYDQLNDAMYLLGRNSGNGAVEMYAFSPAAPGALTNIPLSGAALSTNGNPPLVYDRIADLLRTANSATAWRTIDRTGVVADPGSISENWGGLAYDQATTMVPVELSGFELE
jgi:hypothetical protein